MRSGSAVASLKWSTEQGAELRQGKAEGKDEEQMPSSSSSSMQFILEAQLRLTALRKGRDSAVAQQLSPLSLATYAAVQPSADA